MSMKKYLSMCCALALLCTSASGGVTVSAGGMKTTAAAKLAFFSPGDGIDSELENKLNILISKYMAKGLVEEFAQINTGMEGETTLCVMLNSYESSVELNSKIVQLVKKGQGKTNLTFEPNCNSVRRSGIDDL
jgi:hypothetical protein